MKTKRGTSLPIAHFHYLDNAHIVLSNPGDYNGTFTLTLAYMLTDLLADGPVALELLLEAERNQLTATVRGTMVKFEKGTITFEDGETVLIEDVLRVTVLVDEDKA